VNILVSNNHNFLIKIEKPKISIKNPVVPKQVKVAFVGDCGCGKSSLINYSLDNEEVLDYQGETSLVDIKFKEIFLNSSSILDFGLWDFSGKQDSIRIRTELYPEFQAIAYCFDLSNKKSFNNVESFWMKEVEKYGGSKLKPVCIGLKSDLTKAVDFGTVSNFCKSHKMNYFEISIKDFNSVKKFFYDFGAVLFDSVKNKRN
jgi:Ras-related protein Rab-6A